MGVLFVLALVAAMVAISEVAVTNLSNDWAFMSAVGLMRKQTMQVAFDMRTLALGSKVAAKYTAGVTAARKNLAGLRATAGSAFLTGPQFMHVTNLWTLPSVVLQWNVSTTAVVDFEVNMWDGTQDMVQMALVVTGYSMATFAHVRW